MFSSGCRLKIAYKEVELVGNADQTTAVYVCTRVLHTARNTPGDWGVRSLLAKPFGKQVSKVKSITGMKS